MQIFCQLISLPVFMPITFQTLNLFMHCSFDMLFSLSGIQTWYFDHWYWFVKHFSVVLFFVLYDLSLSIYSVILCLCNKWIFSQTCFTFEKKISRACNAIVKVRDAKLILQNVALFHASIVLKNGIGSVD